MGMYLQAGLLLLIVVLSGAQAWRDFSRGDLVWAGVASICAIAAIIVLLIPIPSHAVKYDILR